MKAYLKEDVIAPLWNAYKKTPEFNSGKTKAINENHKLVRAQELEGLRAIYKTFVQSLSGYKSQKEVLLNRNASDWLDEWRKMHDLLYKHILKERLRGIWRKEDVRFGSPGDEERHGIPKAGNVNYEISYVAEHMGSFLLRGKKDETSYKILAKFHYQFIKIHPFSDGNGRIARAITDQLAIFFDLPPAMGGYPRHDQRRRDAYHKAIQACVEDSECSDLAAWIKTIIEKQIFDLA